MRAAGIEGVRRGKGVRTTKPDPAAAPHPDLVQRNVGAFLLFLTFTAHVCAVLFHTLGLRDRLLDRMALWPTKPVASQQDEIQALRPASMPSTLKRPGNPGGS